ncbi:MAG TPA: hypothetical protein DDY91_12400 [Planctomycetaceae bacterium]|nr:hypothetical protein [Planctomycetaceae bacterium]
MVTGSQTVADGRGPLPGAGGNPAGQGSFGTSLVAGVLIAALVLLLQVLSGAHRAELNSHPDEPAHVVTGVFLHDWIGAGLPDWRRFGDRFYAHYPKVALGHWPPGFYVVQGAWYAGTGVSRTAALALQAFLSILLALLTARLACRAFGGWYALPAAIVLLSNGWIQWATASVMTEIPMALLTLAATAQYASYLRRDHEVRSSLLFGLLASAALLTKGSGLLLAGVPPLAIVLTRDWQRVKTWPFWLPALVVLLLCGPWHLLTLRLQRQGLLHDSFSLDYVAQALPYFGTEFAASLGPAGVGLLLFALVGVIRNQAASKDGAQDSSRPLLACLTALVISALLLCLLVPASLEARHLVPAIPPAVLLAFAAIRTSLAWLSRESGRRLPGAALICVLLTMWLPRLHRHTKPPTGFQNAVRTIVDSSASLHPVCFICSDEIGEGGFIVESVTSGPRPGLFALRSSKLLARDSWDGRGYATRYATVEAVRQLLTDLQVEFLVMDESVFPEERDDPHNRQVRELLATFPDDWTDLARFDRLDRGKRYPLSLRVLRRTSAPNPPPDPETTLQRILKIQGSKTR